MARLGDVCEVINGFAFKSEQYVDSGIRIIRIANVQKGYLEDAAPVFYPSESKEAKKYSLVEDDILMSLTGNVGRVAKLSREFLPAALNQRVACLRIKDGVDIDKAFLFNLLNSDYFEQQCISASKGVAQKNMSTEWLKEYEIPTFSLERQRLIAGILDKTTELISLRKQQLAKLDELVKSRFIELFIGKGYPVTSIKELLMQNSTVEKVSNTKIEKFVTVGIKGKGAREREIKDGKWPVPFSGYRVKEGQFIYSRIDARNGAFAILPKEVDGAVVSKDFPVFEIKADKMLPNVLLFSVLQDDFVRQIQNSSFGATNRQRIQEEVFGEYRITLPPMEIQNQFAAFVAQTDKSKLAVKQSIEKLETLKKSLMQQYFG